MGLINTGCREKLTLFAGGFATGDEKGLSVFEFDPGNGNLKLITEADAGPNPVFFCFSRNHHLIYVLNEVMDFGGNPASGLTTLYYDSGNWKTEKKGEITVPYGGGCFIALSADSGFLFIASYASGSVAVVKLDEKGLPETVTDTILYTEKARDVSHAHMLAQDPRGKYVYLADLGLDRIRIYDLDKETGKLIPVNNGIVSLPEGSGPRHFVFNAEGSRMYLINELNSTITFLNVDETGDLKPVQTMSTVKEGFTGKNSGAEILFGKGEKFIYGSNRGENSIVIFKVSESGTLSLAGNVSCGGDWPRNFVIDPTGEYLFSGNQQSGDISVFKINQRTGIPEGPVSNALMKAPAYLEFL